MDDLEIGKFYRFRPGRRCSIFLRRRLEQVGNVGLVLRLSSRGAINNAGPEVEIREGHPSDGDNGWRSWFPVSALTWEIFNDDPNDS